MIKNISLSAGLLIAIIVLINLVGTEFHLRLDLTEDKEYTLSKATIDILNNLEDAVTIKSYFSEDLPPQYVVIRQGFQETLIEYADRSDGKIVYEFINPNADETREQEALKAGVQPLMINVREKDQMKQQKAFMGAVISLGDKSEVIPFVQPGSATEYAISTAIKKLSVKEKPVVGLLQGHGEPPLAELIEVRESLEVLYEVKEIQLNDTTDIPSDLKTAALIRPTAPFSENEIQKLNNFLSRGGNLVVAINRVDGNLQNASGNAITTGLEQWLKALGVEVEDNFVIDAQCAAITLQQQTGFGIFSQQVSFPYLPVISAFAQHPITGGLESVVLQFASNIKYTGDSSTRFMPIAFSSAKSAVQKAPLMFDVQRQWSESDFPLENIPVAGVLEKNSAATGNSRVVVIADGDFPINGPPQQARRIQPDNVNLMVNSIDWLADDTGLIDLRTKGASSRPIRQLEESSRTLIKYANFLMPLVLAMAYGIYRFQRNRNRQYKLMSENFDVE